MRVILFDGQQTVAEFGFLRLDAPPRAVLFDGETYCIDHPLVAFTEGGGRKVCGWAYRFEKPMKLRAEDRLTPNRLADGQGGA